MNTEQLINSCGERFKFLLKTNVGWFASSISFKDMEKMDAIEVLKCLWGDGGIYFGKTINESLQKLKDSTSVI